MDIEKLIEDLRGLLKQYGEKIPYGELVGAPWPYSRAGDLVWQDPEPYFIEQAATALSTLQAENEKLRAELERCKEKNAGLALALLTECAPNPDCLGDDEWRAIRAELERVKRERDAAVLRHILAAWNDPYRIDPESGLPHIAHVATNIAFLLEVRYGEKPL